MAKDRTGPGLTTSTVVTHHVGIRGDFGRGVRCRINRDVFVQLLIAEAVHGTGRAGAAWVEPNDVEVLQQPIAQDHPGQFGVRRPGTPGPPGLTTNEPTGWPAAGTRKSANSNVCESGS